MTINDFQVTAEKLIGKQVVDVAVTLKAVVVKFTDGRFLDVYLDASSQVLKTSANKLVQKNL